MRDLALRLAESGHEVTYLTMRHWSTHAPPSLPGVRLFGLTAPGRIYDQERRTLGPPLRFGFAVGRHLFRHRGDYDVVHIASFPYFPLLAAGALRRRGRYRLFVDWHEVWSLAYWRRYAGSVVGTIGWLVQRRCLRLPQRAFCFSQMNAARPGPCRLCGQARPREARRRPRTGVREGEETPPGTAARDLRRRTATFLRRRPRAPVRSDGERARSWSTP